MTVYLAKISPYICGDLSDAFLNRLEQEAEPGSTVDIAGCHLLRGANIVIGAIIKSGYRVIDSQNAFNNAILAHNRELSEPDLSKAQYINTYPDTKETLFDEIRRRRRNTTYICGTESHFPVALLSQIIRPEIVWHIPSVSFSDYVRYAWKMLYFRNGRISAGQFQEAMNGEAYFELLAFNTLYKFKAPDPFIFQENAGLPFIETKLTWLEAFHQYKILPYSLGRQNHTPKTVDDPYYKAVNNIVNSLVRIQEGINLKKFLEGRDL